MNQHQRTELRELQTSGVKAEGKRQPPMNAAGASETTKHFVAKQLVAFVAAQDYGYMTGVEVPTCNDYDLDVLLWGLSDRLNYCVECETSPTQEVKERKKQQYVDNHDPVDDILFVNVSKMPLDVLEAKGYIREELGL